MNQMNKKKTSYSEAIREIESRIQRMENEELDVDEISENVARVSDLLRQCREKLFLTEKEVKSILAELENTSQDSVESEP